MAGVLRAIHKNSARLRALDRQVDLTFAKKDESAESRKHWLSACERFIAEYDSLAFPGGLEAGLARIKAGDAEVIEAALTYLENPACCYRFAMIAPSLKRAIGKATMPGRLAARFASWKRRQDGSRIIRAGCGGLR